MRIHNPSLGMMLTALTLTTACQSADSYDLEEFRTTSICTSSCGNTTSNSPEFNEYQLHTLGLVGQENDDGLAVAGIRSPAGIYQSLGIEGDELIASGNGVIPTMGAGLVGWTILLRDGSETLEVHVLDYGTTSSWASGAAPISAYALAYDDPTADRLVSVCPDADPSDTVVTILGGVVYDHETHEVRDDDGWMTLGCAGNAAFKMKLMAYSRHSQVPGYEVTEEDRQATIQMITADYCGLGVPFTAQGVPLDWQNSIGTVSPSHNVNPDWGDVEAIWDEKGAICLSNPRLATLAEVEVFCELPPCDEDMLQSPHTWVSWVVP